MHATLDASQIEVQPLTDNDEERLNVIKAEGKRRRLGKQVLAALAITVGLLATSPDAREIITDTSSTAVESVTDGVERLDTWMNGPKDTTIVVEGNKAPEVTQTELPPLTHSTGE